MRLYVTSAGCPRTGVVGGRAIIETNGLDSPRALAAAKEALAETFTEIWDEPAEVVTEAELAARDAAESAADLDIDALAEQERIADELGD